ncbi:uncharacterized protein LOC131436888 [Malaya genurostris]|uniref:uncharacterized protein LOC131436888 n=1 Tax=Malaya genurostris TaxID=325434 RepID=UPI0026F3BB26|nr:uncharacterized protein LOC131436888 [Malaya genurostris]
MGPISCNEPTRPIELFAELDDMMECDEITEHNGNGVPSSGTTLDEARTFRAPFDNEYIKKKTKTPGKINELKYSARFTHQTMDIKLHSEGCLMLVNDELLAKVIIEEPEILDKTVDFEQAKQVLLKQLKIVEVYYDYFTTQRTKFRIEFLKALEEIKSKSGNEREFAKDCIALWGILSDFECYGPFSHRSVCEEIVKNHSFSEHFIDIATKLHEVECTLLRRSDLLPCTAGLMETDVSDLMKALKQVQSTAVEVHRKYLLGQAPEFFSLHLKKVSPQLIMFVRESDVELFTNLADNLAEYYFQEALENLAKRFVLKVNAIKIGEFSREESLTDPVYILLCKYLEELLEEIEETKVLELCDMIILDDAGWHPDHKLKRKNEAYSTKCLEREYLFIFKLLQHFEPGPKSECKPFEYNPKTLVCSEGQSAEKFNLLVEPYQALQESYVWYCLVDDALSSFASKSLLVDYEAVLRKYIALIREASRDQLERVRDLSHCLVHFIACTIWISEQDMEADSKVERQILQMQVNHLVPEVTLDSSTTNRFRDLVTVFINFWNRKRNVIASIPSKVKLSGMSDIAEALLNIALVALEKDVKTEPLLEFIRAYNSFLDEFKDVSFDWLIEAIPGLDIQNEIPRNMIKLVDVGSNHQIFQVTEPVKFIQILQILHSHVQIPKHYMILIIKAHLSLFLLQLNRKQWSSGLELSETDQITTTATFISSMRRRLPDLNYQLDYDSFEHFLTTKVEPISSLVKDSKSAGDFESRIQYKKEQPNRVWAEIKIDSVTTLVKYSETNRLREEQLLRKAFQHYSDQYQQYLILAEDIRLTQVLEDLKTIPRTLKFQSWDDQFKQVQLPKILAGIAVLWFTLAYETESDELRNPKLHNIQAMCILRLLGVDKPGQGVPKHFAGIPAGQGKTLAVRLIAILLALTGHSVCIFCCNEQLATRDCAALEQISTLLEIQESISYTTINRYRKSEPIRINGQRVMYAGSELDSDEFTATSKRLMTGSLNKSVLLVDDVDLYRKWYRYDPSIVVILPGLDKIQSQVWNMTSKEKNVDVVRKSIFEYMESSEFAEKNRWKKFFDGSDGYVLLSKGIRSYKYFNNKTLFEEHLKAMIESACYIRKQTYPLNSDYDKIFTYLKHAKKNAKIITGDKINYGYINISFISDLPSVAVLDDFPLVLGVFGSAFIQLEKSTSEQVCGIKEWTVMPSVFGNSKLQFRKDLNFSIEQGKMKRIADTANAMLAAHRSVIVVFEESFLISFFLHHHGGQFKLLNIVSENTPDAEKQRIIKKAGVPGTVTLVTRDAGQVLDYKSSGAVEKAGGIHVIQTFFSDNPMEENRIMGRTARNGNNGSYELIVCSLAVEDSSYEEIDAIRTKSRKTDLETIPTMIQNDSKLNEQKGAMKSFSNIFKF